MLTIKHEATFFGANPFSSNPVLVANVIVSDGGTRESIDALKQGCLRLHEIFPEWFDAPIPAMQEPIVEIAQTAAQWALASLNEVHGFLHDLRCPAHTRRCAPLVGFSSPERQPFRAQISARRINTCWTN